MVIIGFKVFKDKIETGLKFRTLRKRKEYYLRLWPGDFLHLYWKPRTPEMELIHKVRMRNYVPTTFAAITEAEARMDGFNSLEEMRDFLRETYKSKAESQDYLWIIWDPPCVKCKTQMKFYRRLTKDGFEIYVCPKCGQELRVQPSTGDIRLSESFKYFKMG